jgi:hypothetical protein
MKLEANFIEVIKRKLTGADKDTREKVYTFLVCLGISVFIWFLIALSSESSTSLEYPIQFTNAPTDMVLVNKPDSNLVFRIQSAGFELLTLKYLNRRKPIEINLEYLNLTEQDGYYSASYQTSQISSEILKQYNFSEELVSIAPQNIWFRFERLLGKKVPVVPNVEFTFEKQYRIKGNIVITPDSVQLMGSATILKNIEKVETQFYKVEAVNSNGNFLCRFNSPMADNGLTIAPAEGEISWEVEKFTESTIEVPIISSGLDKVKIFPAHAKITFHVGLDDYNRVNADMFSVVADIHENSTENLARVNVTMSPSFVDIIRIAPQEVEFLILQE